MTDECVYVGLCVCKCGRETRDLTRRRGRKREERLKEKMRKNRRMRRRMRRAHKSVACVQTSGTSSRKHRETFSRSPCSNVRPQVIYSPSN